MARLPLLPLDANGRPANDPLSQYKISDDDAENNPQYYGFVGVNGEWYILKSNSTDKTYRYAAGTTSYPTAWTNRASLGYDYFDIIF